LPCAPRGHGQTLNTINLHLQALSRILSEEEGEEDKDKRPAGSDVPRDEIDQVRFLLLERPSWQNPKRVDRFGAGADDFPENLDALRVSDFGL